MHKSLVVLLSLVAVAIIVGAAALAGILTDRAIAAVLLVAGLLLVVLRNDLALWAHTVGARSRLLSHWQLLRPFTVALVGGSLIAFAGITFLEAVGSV